MQDPFRLAELLCARLCHDLSGPLGSLIGAAELAAEPGAESGEAIAVATDAASTLGKRLKLLRTAWCGDPAPLDVPRLIELAEGLGIGRRVRVDFSGLDPSGVFSPAAGRLALNVLLLGTEAVAGNGRLALAGSAGGDVLTTIEGPRAAWPAGLAAWIADEDAAWGAIASARTIQGPLTALIARRGGLNFALLMPTGAASAPAPLLFGPSAAPS